MACNATTAGRRAKQTAIWESRTLVIHIWGTYDLVVLKVILGSFGALFYLVTQNRLAVEQKWS